MELRDETAPKAAGRRARNGGFPEPPAGEPVRIVRAAHRTCGGETRIRLSTYLPARAVQRVVCEHCDVSYVCDRVEVVDEGAAGRIAVPATEAAPQADGAAPIAADAAPAAEGAPEVDSRRRRRPQLPPPDSGLWRWVGIPVAAVAVIAGIVLVQGGDESSEPVVVGAPGAASEDAGRGSGSAEARFISQPGFSLALPPGWRRSTPEGGAAFAAGTADGAASATLWIQEAPDLTFAAFEARSLEQLRSLTGGGEVVDRVAAPTEEGTVVTLRSGPAERTAETPAAGDAGAPAAEAGGAAAATWEVTLRAAGPYRYHLATVVQPDAPRDAREGAELIHGSFVPEPEGAGKVRTGVVPGGAAAAGGEPATEAVAP